MPFRFTLQDNQVEAPEEKANKMKSFFIYAVGNWDAEFYAKVNDDVYVNLGMWSLILSGTLKYNASLHLNSLVYIHNTRFSASKKLFLSIRRNHI